MRVGFFWGFVCLVAFAGQVVRAEDPPRPPPYQLFVPTIFQTPDRKDESRYDSQRLEERLQSLDNLGDRMKELAPLMAKKKSGEGFTFRLYFPKGKPPAAQEAMEATVRAAWVKAFPNTPLVVERRFVDRTPANASASELEDARPAIDPADMPPPGETGPAASGEGWWSWMKSPGIVRKIKGAIGTVNALVLGGFRGYLLSRYGIDIAGWVALGLDVPIEYLYKKYQVPFNRWMAKHPLPFASRFGGWYQNLSDKYRGMSKAKLLAGNFFLLNMLRPAGIEHLSWLNHMEPGGGVTWQYLTMLAVGGLAFLPQFIMGYNGYEKLRQMGYITEGEMKLALARGGLFSLLSLIAMSSGIPATRWALLGTVPAEFVPYWNAWLKARKRGAVNDRLLLMDPELAGNRLDLNWLEATEYTERSDGKSVEELWETARAHEWKELPPPPVRGPGLVARVWCGFKRLLGR